MAKGAMMGSGGRFLWREGWQSELRADIIEAINRIIAREAIDEEAGEILIDRLRSLGLCPGPGASTCVPLA
jgi:hypothetical protein